MHLPWPQNSISRSIRFLVGFDNAKKVYSCVGDPDQRITFTSKEDIGRALAELSILSMSRLTVPDFVTLCGFTASFKEIKDAAARELGDIKLQSQSLVEYKREIEASLKIGEGKHPEVYVR